MQDQSTTKRCPQCGETKELSAWAKNKARHDGLQSWCKDCMNAKQRRDRADDPEAAREYDRNYRRANTDATKWKNHKWIKANLSHVRAVGKQWKRQNRDRINGYGQKRRARQRDAFIEDVALSVVFERDGGVCGICHREVKWPDASIDHVIPLSKGGEHSYRNVQLAHRRCNYAKSDRGGGQLRLWG